MRSRSLALLAFLAIGLGGCLGRTEAPVSASEAAVLPILRSGEANTTLVPIQERHQLLGTAERELDRCESARVPPTFGGDRRPRMECVDPRFPVPKSR